MSLNDHFLLKFQFYDNNPINSDGYGIDDLELAAIGSVVDTTSPAAITDLSASTGRAAGAVNLRWTASGDDDNTGTALAYIVRYNTSQITQANWDSSTDVTGEPTPGPAGSAESMTVSGLTLGQTYYFSIKTQDEVPNTSGISNSPSAIACSSDDGCVTVYLPLFMNKYIHYPPVSVQDHTIGIDGLVTVPLTGSGTATFRLIDRLEQPVANVPVVSIENEYGVTLIAAAQDQGFFPKLWRCSETTLYSLRDFTRKTHVKMPSYF